MIFDMILGFLVVGWTINASIIQARQGLAPTFWINAVLATAAVCTLVWRLE